MEIVAAYFPGWVAPPGVPVSWYSPSPWLNNPLQGRYNGDYSERYPLYGATNEDQQWVIDLHLMDAKTAGITAFAVCWYRNEHSNYALERIKASAVQGVKFCLLWANHAPRMDPVKTTREYLLGGIRLAAQHSMHQRCYKKNGRPVFILYSSEHLDDVIRSSKGVGIEYTPTQAEVDVLSVEIKAAFAESGAAPYLVIQTSDPRWQCASDVDATTDYAIRCGTFGGVFRMAHSYSELRLACAQRATVGAEKAKESRKGYWPTLMAGRDQRAWGGTPDDPLADNCTPTKAEFMEASKEALTASLVDGCERTVFLYAWNELGEGGYVMPTKGTAHSRINALAAVLPLYT